MHLSISKHSPLNDEFTNESGQTVYKVSTVSKSIATISRAVTLEKDRFERLATVDHHTFQTSIIKYEGKEIKAKEYFKKFGLGSHGSHRAFTGPDGKEYKWFLYPASLKLCLDEEEETLVAQFHRKGSGAAGEAHPASLEIFAPGQEIVDHIVITFIYVEKLREQMMKEAYH